MLRETGGAARGSRSSRFRCRRREGAVAHGGVLRQAGGAAGRSRWCRLRWRCGEGAMAQRRMFGRAGRIACRSCWRGLRCGIGQCAMPHRSVLRRAGGLLLSLLCRNRRVTHVRIWSWRRLGCWRRQRAMAHRRMLRTACGAVSWSSWRRLRTLLSNSRCRYASEEDGKHHLHATSPSSGRTFTMRIIPACMW